MNKKTIIILVIILIIIAVGILFLMQPKAVSKQTEQGAPEQPQAQPKSETQDQSKNNKTPTSYEIQGMKIETLKEGSGETAKAGDTVTVNYTGTLENGTKFDSSVDPAFNHVDPFSFTLGQNRVIQGWELGVLGMKVGEKRKLTIPPELGYGSQSPSPSIPANSTLIFEVELLGINQ